MIIAEAEFRYLVMKPTPSSNYALYVNKDMKSCRIQYKIPRHEPVLG